MLWPEGRNIQNISCEFVNILDYSLKIISWQENLTSDEMPPYWMWHLEWEIDKHFKKVKRDRDKKYGNESQVEDLDPDYEENLLYQEFLDEMG